MLYLVSGVATVEIRANFTSFAEAEQDLQQVLWAFESVLDSLEENLELTLAEWSGDAQRAYAEARATWDRAARDLHAELARLHKAIKRTHHNFRSASDTNVRMWSG
jgi:WXG100 family type VII secretion target